MKNINFNSRVSWPGLSLLFCAALLTACGGGGGGANTSSTGTNGNSTTAAGAWLELSPSSLNVTAYEGQIVDVRVQAKFNKELPSNTDLTIVDPKGLIETGSISFMGVPGGTRANIRINPTLKVGDYSTKVELKLCEDSPSICAKPLPGSPWLLPLSLTVKPATNLTALTDLSQASAWQTRGGNAANTAYVPVQLDAARFSQRFRHIHRTWDSNRGDLEPVHDAGLTFVISKTADNPLALLAIDEASGKLVWQKVLGEEGRVSVSSPAAGHGKVYLAGWSGEGTWLKVFDQKTGAVSTTILSGGVETSQTPIVTATGVYLAGNYRTLSRFDLKGNLLWQKYIDLEYYRAFVANEDYVYVLWRGQLTILSAASGDKVFETALVPNTTSATALLPVLDARKVLYVVVKGSAGTPQLVAYDTLARKLLWEVKGDFAPALALAGKVLYVMKDEVLQAYSTADGKLLWTSARLPFRFQTLNNIAYRLLATDNLVFVSDRYDSFAVDSATQQMVWQYQQGGSISISPKGLFYMSSKIYLPNDKTYDAAALTAINLR